MSVIHPQKTKQLVPNLRITEGERTEVAINAKTDDRITKGAGNVFKKVQLQIYNRPTGIVWVQFDNADVGEKTRVENNQLFKQGSIQPTWTPIKGIKSQFAVGKKYESPECRKAISSTTCNCENHIGLL